MKASRRGIVRVSDHALLRLLQRAGGVDVEAFRAQIEAALSRAVAKADGIGGGHYRILADGLVYVVRDNVVATVLTDAMPVTDQLRPAGKPADD